MGLNGQSPTTKENIDKRKVAGSDLLSVNIQVSPESTYKSEDGGTGLSWHKRSVSLQCGG